MLLSDVDSALVVNIHIDDPADEANYYRLTINYEGSYEVMFREDIYTKRTPRPPIRRLSTLTTSSPRVAADSSPTVKVRGSSSED